MTVGEQLVSLGLTEDVAATAFAVAGLAYVLSAMVIRARLKTLQARGGFDGELPTFLSMWQFKNWGGLAWAFGDGPKKTGDNLIRVASTIFRLSTLLMFVFGFLAIYLSLSAEHLPSDHK